MAVTEAVRKKFAQWYQIDNPDCPEDLKPVIVDVYDHCPYGTTIFLVKIPKTSELQVARVFPIGDGAEISIDHTFSVNF